jgi:FxsC-like protein
VPYFFLSYARGADDVWVKKFYQELCDELRRRSGAPAEDPVGFIDTGIGVGIRWSTELEEALASCQVFLALYSPRYFLRENCGKEWAYFSERVRRYEQQTGRHCNSIIPVVWVPLRDLPLVAKEINYRDEGLGAIYTHKGLYRIIRVNRFQDDYQEFLGELASRIIDVAGTHPLPQAEQISINGVASAFPEDWVPWSAPPAEQPESADVRARSGVATPSGPAWLAVGSSRHVQFVVIATGTDGAPPERTQRQYYGDYAADWRPYLPESDDRLSLLAQRGALNHGFTTSLATISDDMLERLDHAKARNQVTVLLVDAWATGIEPHRQLLRQYDDRNEPTTGVIVPWNETDEEMAGANERLTATLHDVFPNNLVRRDSVFRDRVENVAAFQVVLSEVLAEAQNRVFSLGNVRRRAQGAGGVSNRPVLDAP